MKKFLLPVFVLMSVLLFSQNRRNLQRQIDSIAQNKWDSASINLDSIANPKLIQLNVPFKDTLVIRDKLVVSNVGSDFPVTPYRVMQLPNPVKWFYFGQNNLVFNQSSFSNWNSGGNNNIGIIGKINYNLMYKNGRHFLDNTVKMGYGFVSGTGQAARKTEDYINLVSNYGYEYRKNYYFSAGFQLLSQFATGFNYSLTPDPTYEDRISKFFAPAYLTIGLGVSYNPNENFQVIFRPVNGKFTFVIDPYLQKAGRYGLEHDGQSVKSDIGSLLNLLYRIKIYENMTFTNQANFFSSYVSHPDRVVFSYNGTLDMRVNKFISAVVSLDLLYDHDQIEKMQMKQTLGVGFSYNIGLENRDRDKKMIKQLIVK